MKIFSSPISRKVLADIRRRAYAGRRASRVVSSRKREAARKACRGREIDPASNP